MNISIKSQRAAVIDPSELKDKVNKYFFNLGKHTFQGMRVLKGYRCIFSMLIEAQ